MSEQRDRLSKWDMEFIEAKVINKVSWDSSQPWLDNLLISIIMGCAKSQNTGEVYVPSKNPSPKFGKMESKVLQNKSEYREFK